MSTPCWVDADGTCSPGAPWCWSIRTFGSRAAAEDAIMAASALMREVGGPLSGVFDQVISENEDALPQVQDFSYEDGGGIVPARLLAQIVQQQGRNGQLRYQFW